MTHSKQVRKDSKIVAKWTDEATGNIFKGMALLRVIMDRYEISPLELENLMRELVKKEWEEDTPEVDPSVYSSIMDATLKMFP